MFKKHLAILLLLVMASFAYGQSIPSGTARYEALGNSPFILDAAIDINSNPAWSNYYRNYGFGDIGRSFNADNPFILSEQYAGATFGISDRFNLGLIVNKRRDVWNQFSTYSEFGDLGVAAPVVPTTLILGFSASKNFHIALAPYFAMWSNSYQSSENAPAQFTVDNNSSSLGADLGILYMIKKGWFEADVKFGMNNFESDVTSGDPAVNVVIDNDGGMEIAALLRGWIYPSSSSKLAIIPYANFQTFSFTPKSITAENFSALDYNWMNFGFGAGVNLPIMDDIQVAAGLSMGYNSFTADSLSGAEYKFTNLTLPGFKMAVETRIADWLTGRVGFSRGVNRISQEGTPNLLFFEKPNLLEDNITGTTPDEQTLSLGAGFHFGRFSIDATVSERWLKQGINFVSGQSTDLFGVISASYNFNTR